MILKKHIRAIYHSKIKNFMNKFIANSVKESSDDDLSLRNDEGSSSKDAPAASANVELVGKAQRKLSSSNSISIEAFNDHNKVDHSLMSENPDKTEDQLIKIEKLPNDKKKGAQYRTLHIYLNL